jgi:hypothetical protein
MQGFERGFIGPGSGRVAEIGSHTGSLEILWIVLGLILWAAVVATLVLVMIRLIQRMRTPRDGTDLTALQPALANGATAQPAAHPADAEQTAAGRESQAESAALSASAPDEPDPEKSA